MNLADYRRFVSYIYAYRNGKKEKNTGFAKVEARKKNLRISIQLEAPGNRETSLDAYGFIRKGEKIFGIFLGEMERTSGQLYFLKAETDTDNIKESGYGLNQLSGLWIKGEAGENYITIWDDEPVKRMDLEIEMEPENEKPAESGMLEKAPAETPPELKQLAKTPVEQSLLNGVRAQEAGLIAGMEVEEDDDRDEESESAAETIENGLMETEAELSEESAGEMMPDSLANQSPGDQDQKQKDAEEIGQQDTQNQAAESGKEDASYEMDGTVAVQASEPEPSAVKLTASDLVYAERYVSLWERLSPAYAHRNPFQDGEAADAIMISPRELHFFCCKNWSAAKNSFIYHGYYNFHHLLFGKAADGTFFLAVPGTYSPQEQRMAASFGFPLFKESRDKSPTCRRGYWCRLL